MTLENLGILARIAPEYAQLSAALDRAAFDIRVAIPGTIVSFDPVKQVARVQVNIRENIRQGNTTAPMAIPILPDVPVVIPRAGGFALTMPVSAGDECLVIFADACIDAWWQSGGQQNQITKRRHDLSDGFAILGPWSQPNVISAYSTTAAELRSLDGTVKVSLASGGVTVTAPNVTVTGSTAVTVTGNGQTKIEDRVFLEHTHSGVSTGSGVSGPVV